MNDMDMDIGDIDENELMNIEQDCPSIIKELASIFKYILPISPTSNKTKQLSPLHKKRFKWFQREAKKDQHPDLVFELPKLRRSAVWSINLYRSLYYKKKLQNFVICKKCKILFSYKTKIGVTHLLKHKCYAETLKLVLYNENDINVSFVLPSTIYPNDKVKKNVLKDFRLVRQNGILTNFIYCIKCKDLFYAKPGLELIVIIKQHISFHSTDCSLSLLSETQPLIEKLESLILAKAPSVKLYRIEKSLDENCIWYYNIYRLIEYNGKIESFLYCINCASLIRYELNEEESEENKETILKHKCVITVYRDTDFKKKETVIDPENHLTFEIQILDEGNDEDDDDDENCDDLAPNNSNNISKSLKITLPPILLDKKYMEFRLTKRVEFIQACVLNAKVKASSGVIKPLPQSTDDVINNKKTQNLSQLYLKFIATNYLPLEIFETKSFNRLARSLMSAGKYGGKFQITENWLSSTKIDINLKNHVLQIKHQLAGKFMNEKLAYSCDIWENFNDQTLNVTLRAHFIDKSFNLITTVLGTNRINSSVREKHQNDTSNDWLINCSQDILYKCLIQTPINIRRDKAASLLLRCSGFVSMHKFSKKSSIKYTIKCAATSLNKIINNILYNESNELINLGRNVLKLLLNSINVTTKSSSASLSSLNLKREIKNCNLNDWVSILNFVMMFKDLILVADNEEFQNVNSLIKLLKPVKLALQCLGNIESTTPTINMVCVVKHKLLNDLDALKGQCKIFELVRGQLHVSILQEFIINDFHKIASFLDPRFKTMKFLLEKERVRIFGLVKRIINNDDNNKNNVGDRFATGEEKHLTEYMDNGGINVENRSLESDEINHYFTMSLAKCFSNSRNKNVVLEFWNSHPELPKLRALAKRVLSIPASANIHACKFSSEAIDLIRKRSFQSASVIDTDTAHVIHGNFHLVEFQ